MAVSQGAWGAGPPPGIGEKSLNACVRIVQEHVRKAHSDLVCRDISNVPIPCVCELIFPISEIKVKKLIGGVPVKDVIGWLKCRVLKILGEVLCQGIMVYSLAGALGVRVREVNLERVQAAVKYAIRELETPPPQVAFSIHIGGTAPLDRYTVCAIMEDLVPGAVVAEVRMLKGRGEGPESCLRSPDDTDASAMYGVSAIVDVVSSFNDQVSGIPQRVDFLLPSGYVVPLSLAMSVLPRRVRSRGSVPRPPSCSDARVPPPAAESVPPPSTSVPLAPPPSVDVAVPPPVSESLPLPAAQYVPPSTATPVLPHVLDPALFGNPFAPLSVDDISSEGDCMQTPVTSPELDPSPQIEPYIPQPLAKKHESGNQARQPSAPPQEEAEVSCAGSSEKGQEEHEKMIGASFNPSFPLVPPSPLVKLPRLVSPLSSMRLPPFLPRLRSLLSRSGVGGQSQLPRSGVGGRSQLPRSVGGRSQVPRSGVGGRAAPEGGRRGGRR